MELLPSKTTNTASKATDNVSWATKYSFELDMDATLPLFFISTVSMSAIQLDICLDEIPECIYYANFGNC